MFEVGKLSDESLDSFLIELEKVNLGCSVWDVRAFGTVSCLILILLIFGTLLLITTPFSTLILPQSFTLKNIKWMNRFCDLQSDL